MSVILHPIDTGLGSAGLHNAEISTHGDARLEWSPERLIVTLPCSGNKAIVAQFRGMTVAMQADEMVDFPEGWKLAGQVSLAYRVENGEFANMFAKALSHLDYHHYHLVTEWVGVSVLSESAPEFSLIDWADPTHFSR